MPLDKIGKVLVKIFGSRNERLIKHYSRVVDEINALEPDYQQMNDTELKATTNRLKQQLAEGRTEQEILPDAFAAVREASDRHVGIRNVLLDEYKFDPSRLGDDGRATFENLKRRLAEGIDIHELDVPIEFNAEIRQLFPQSKPPFRFRHFDVQMIGGQVLFEGKIAEMVTGEGKTLVATLAAYLVHLTGRKVHIVTVNDYLAKRDAEWMGPVYRALGLTVGAIQADMDTAGSERKAQYECDITYGTNNEFGFDYLRDNMKLSLEQMVQGALDYAIIDEVDSILIDEARTPLIISGPAFDEVGRYKKADSVASHLLTLQSRYSSIKKQINTAQRQLANAEGELADAKKQKDRDRVEKAQMVIENKQAELEAAQAKLSGATEYFEIETDRKAVHLTHEGITAAQDAAGVGSFFTGSNMEWPHMLEQSLRAHTVFEKEKDYVVMDGKVVIVDEFTGRLMHGRQWSDGLHQAVEAKEGVAIKEETQTLATITLQNFFKLYGQIAGMTGTAITEAQEFMDIYKLEVVVIPTNEPCIRENMDDVIYKSMAEKFDAILEEINDVSAAGRPVLVGTTSIEKNEELSEALSRRYGIEHEVLNAKHHAREAVIIAKAGQQHHARDKSLRGNVTIATNMAGRGTDIKLGPAVLFEVVKVEDDPYEKGIKTYTIKQQNTGNQISFKSTDPLADVFPIREGQKWVGGLHIVGTERHEARRIDNQLRGRSGRQGDPGSSRFFLSFDDELMQLFGGDRIPKLLSLVGWSENEPIFHPTISKQIAKVQRKVEQRNFEARKSLLEYDEVMDYQRKIFYSRRRKILEGKGLKAVIEQMIESVLERSCQMILSENYPYSCAAEWLRSNFSKYDLELNASDIKDASADEIERLAKTEAKKNAANNISLSIGEYLEDYQDRSTWDVQGLCKWAMSSFSVDRSPGKLKHAEPEEIEEQLISDAEEQIDKKDCSELAGFLKPDFGLRSFSKWARIKFGITLKLEDLKGQRPEQIHQRLSKSLKAGYRKREIEYPVEVAMNMAYGPEGPNTYGFEALAEWANRKFNAGLSFEQIQHSSPRAVRKQLLELSENFNNGQLLEEIADKISQLEPDKLVGWARERFEANLNEDDLTGPEQARTKLLEAGTEFLRRELSDLEKYMLVYIYDTAWKEHLYGMDHLKEGVFLRAWAERDPKVEYKQEGYRMFTEMLAITEERVTDNILKKPPEAGARARSVWQVSGARHDEVNQFAMTERQRAAAAAPQGETKVKQIKLDKPKVGRNDPCPCGSGKKYKKCCGAKA